MLATLVPARGGAVAGLSVAAFFALLAVFVTTTAVFVTTTAVAGLAVFFAAVALALFVPTVRHLDLSGGVCCFVWDFASS